MGVKMKTIQQVIREMDSEKIEKAYFYEFPVELWEIDGLEDKTLGKIKERISVRFQAFIERLRKMEIEKRDDEQRILFAYKAQSDEASLGIEVGMLQVGELFEKDDLTEVQTYSYMFTEQKEALGFLVADTKLTQDNLMDVIVQFLNEVSLFGYEQERLKIEIDRLEESIEQLNKYPERFKAFSSEEIRMELGIPKDEEYPEEQEKKRKFYEAAMEYTNYCKCIEIERIKKLLIEGKCDSGGSL